MNHVWADDKQISYHDLAIDEIVTGKNMRSDVGDISELRDSIASVGIIEPLIVNHTSEGYVLVAGERRLRAAEAAGYAYVPCKVFEDMTDSQFYEVMLAENFNRESMSAIDEAKAFRMMLDKYGYTQQYLGGVVGRSQPYIANHLRLLDLPEGVQDLVAKGTLTPAHALQFLSLKDNILYDKLVDYFLKNIPSSVRPVAQFKDQIKSSVYKLDVDSNYLSTYYIGEDVYQSKCLDCNRRLDSYCYDSECFKKLRAAHEERSHSDDSQKKEIVSLRQDINSCLREYVFSLKSGIFDDIEDVLRGSGLSSSELLERFIGIMFPDEQSDDVTFEDLLQYDCREYVIPRLDRNSSVDDLVRVICAAFIREEFRNSLDYETDGREVAEIYSKILRDHGLSSSVYNKHKLKVIQADLDLFDKKLADLDEAEASLSVPSVDTSDLPVFEEGSS